MAISAPAETVRHPGVPDPKPAPVAVPAFISEGSAQEVLLRGKSLDPRTGKELVPADVPARTTSSVK